MSDAQKKCAIPSVEMVEQILLIKKELVRVMEWSKRKSLTNPTWLQFESFCVFGTEKRDDIIFRAHYRPAFKREIGNALIEFPEELTLALFCKTHRIFAIDMQPGHRNKIGKGRTYYKKRIDEPIHIHIWTEQGSGYAEPLKQKADVEMLFYDFLKMANLFLNGDFIHPAKNTQLSLL